MKPALTPEQWRDLSVDGDECVALITKDGNQDLYFAGMGTVREYARHQVAALALHGQPFGFYREDVERITDEAAWYEWRDCAPEIVSHLRSIAARIEALLPPCE
jgi:hypothetical protein